jgi:TRAP-type C4-dicarboxylate transport system permease small subunit
MALLTTTSVLGRYFLSAPIDGDFELSGVGTGIAVFLFLPYVHMTRRNVIVDFFTANASHGVRVALDSLGALLYLAIAVLLTWRTSIGGLEFRESGETTIILGLPRWWTLPLAVACLALLLAVCAYVLHRDLRSLRAKREPA